MPHFFAPLITRRFGVLAALAWGLLAFILTVGPIALNPARVEWLSLGDPLQHYAGWVFYREGPWTFPLGLNPNYGMTSHSSIVFTDSLPLLAIFFKLFSAVLPQPFQYFGLWTLVCFILQAYFAWKLLRLVTTSYWLLFMGLGFFVFSPILLWRMGINSSLAGQFLILAALYFNFRQEPISSLRFFSNWLCLLLVAALVHFYLLTMVAFLWLANSCNVNHLQGNKNDGYRIFFKTTLLQIGLIGICVFLVCWQAGYFVMGSAVSGGNYGIGSANLLGFFDAKGWSWILPSIGDMKTGKELYLDWGRNFEGFNYLGLGSCLLFLIALPLGLRDRKHIQNQVRQYWPLLIAIFVMALIALSNEVRFGPWLSLTIPMPDRFKLFLGLWRSSARLMWPLYYLMLFASITLIIQRCAHKKALAIFAFALTLQIGDSSVGWYPKRHDFYMRESNYITSQDTGTYNANFWGLAAKHYENLIKIVPPVPQDWSWAKTVRIAMLGHFKTNDVYFARMDELATEQQNQRWLNDISNGQFAPKSIYIVNEDRLGLFQLQMNPKTDLLAKVDQMIIFVPNWYSCQACAAVELSEILPNQPPAILLGQHVLLGNSPSAASALLWGWGKPESWGAWSIGNEAMLDLPLPLNRLTTKPLLLELEFQALVGKTHPMQKVAISVNNGPEKIVELTDRGSNKVQLMLENLAKPDLLAVKDVKIHLRFFNAISPKEIGLNPIDSRRLALGFIGFTFSQP